MSTGQQVGGALCRQSWCDIPDEIPVFVGDVVHPDRAVVLWTWVELGTEHETRRKGTSSGGPFSYGGHRHKKHKLLCCSVSSHPSSRVSATPPVLGPRHKEQRCTLRRSSPQRRGCSVSEMRWGNPIFGSSLRRLPTFQTDRDSGVAGDSPLTRHGHRAMLCRLRVILTTLQTKPLTAAPAAAQGFIGGVRRSPAPFIERNDRIHERR